MPLLKKKKNALDTGDNHSGQCWTTLSRVWRADAVTGDLCNATLYPQLDPKFGNLSRVLC
jgi:hypothetical protein